MNKPRAVRNKRTGEITGYKQEVKWRGQRYYFTRRTVAAAERCWANAIADLEAGLHPYDRYEHDEPVGEAATARTTVEDWIERWRKNRRLTPKARANQDSIIDTHIVPDLGRVFIGELSRLQVQEWVWTLEEDYMPRYVRTVYGVLRVALLDAVDEPSVPISASPCVRIRMEPADPTGRQALTPAQVAAIARRCDKTYREVLWSLPFTGARINELLKRDVGDWSPFTGIKIAGRPVEAAVEGQAPRKRKKGTKKAKATKSPAGARTIELCPSHGRMVRDYVDGRPEGPLFRNSLGRRAGYDAVYAAVRVAVAAARKAGEDVPKGVTPHWFRHTAKTWLRDAECDPVAIDERLGHRTPGMDGIYVHATPAMRKKIVDVLEVLWGEAHKPAVVAAEAQ